MSQQYNSEWKLHDIYKEDASFNRTVTRSQIPFATIENSSTDLELFVDKEKHNPPDKPHLMTLLKGPFGAVPRTTITRKLKEYLPESKITLIAAINEYKIASTTVPKGNVELKGKEKQETEDKVIGKRDKSELMKELEEKVTERRKKMEEENDSKQKVEKRPEEERQASDASDGKQDEEREDNNEEEEAKSEDSSAKQDEGNEKDEGKLSETDSNEDEKGKRRSIFGF